MYYRWRDVNFIIRNNITINFNKSHMKKCHNNDSNLIFLKFLDFMEYINL